MSKKSIFYLKRLSLLLFIIVLSGCGCRPPENLTIAKRRVVEYYESSCYQSEFKKIIDSAIKHFEGVAPTGKSTVIFDIDDTSLSSYFHSKENEFGFVPKLFKEWVFQASAPAIVHTKRLYDYLVKKGFTIIFLTGRQYDEHKATVKNLKREGYTVFNRLIVRQKHELDLTAKAYKSANRAKLVEEGFRIVGCIGDQQSDLEGGNSGYTIKVPNYCYMIE